MRTIAIIMNMNSKQNSQHTSTSSLVDTYIQTKSDSLKERQITIQLHKLQKNEDPQALTKKLIQDGFDTIVAAGGDGTINAIAQVLHTSNALLGVIPLGTHNHFSKDLNIPFDVEQALDLIVENKYTTRIDVGYCNNRIFLNNSSLGIYPRIVDIRQTYQGYGHIKLWALILASVRVFLHIPIIQVGLIVQNKQHTKQEHIVKKSAFVFIGNNEYMLGGLKTGTRTSLTKGVLSLWIAQATTRWTLLHLLCRAFLGNLHEHRDFEAYTVKECTIETNLKQIQLSFDGEVTRLLSPLRYRIVPTCLRVISPPPISHTT